mmetsp:Transcript_7156/g.14764  ORF Transcript_7156/g.14764 Transcript_7156/m.14764 type:complete len:113 (+) Transcript_7156:92-430(+)
MELPGRLCRCVITRLGLLRWRFDVCLPSLMKHEQRGENLLRSSYRRKKFSKQHSDENYELSLLQASTRTGTGNIVVSAIFMLTLNFAVALLAVSGETATNLPVGGEITLRLL